MKRVIISMSTLLILASSIISCGGETNTPVVTDNIKSSDRTETTEVDPVLCSGLPDIDWNGRTFMVLGYDDPVYDQFDNFEIWTEKEVGEVVNDAVFRRNSVVEDKYNVKIAQTLHETSQDMMHQSVSSGDHLFDLVFTELLYLGTSIQNGYFYNLYDVEYIDFSKSWWNPEVNDAISMCGKLYATSSDFSLRDKNRAYILMYNIDLAAQLDIPDLVKTARDGKWTSDLMLSYIKDLGGDLDGNGKLGGEFDSFGLVMDSYNSFTTFVFGMDEQIMTKDKNDQPVITMSNERMANVVDRVIELTCDRTYAFFCEDFLGKTAENYWYTAERSFFGGRSLFTTAFPHQLASASEKAEFDYGVMPMPKYDESQEKYYTYADTQCMLMSIPVTSSEPDFSGFMLEVLSAASTNTTLTAYYDIACKTKYSYNPETGEMLDLIFEGIRYDPSIIYSIGDLNRILRSDLPNQKNNVFASLYEKYKSAADASLNDLIETLEALDH